MPRMVMAGMIVASGGFRHRLCELCHLLDARQVVPFLWAAVATEGDSLALIDADQVVRDLVRLNGRTHHGTCGVDKLRADFHVQGLLCDQQRHFDLTEFREGVLCMARSDGLPGSHQSLQRPGHGFALQLQQRDMLSRMRVMAGGCPDKVQKKQR